MMTKISNH